MKPDNKIQVAIKIGGQSQFSTELVKVLWAVRIEYFDRCTQVVFVQYFFGFLVTGNRRQRVIIEIIVQFKGVSLVFDLIDNINSPPSDSESEDKDDNGKEEE